MATLYACKFIPEKPAQKCQSFLLFLKFYQRFFFPNVTQTLFSKTLSILTYKTLNTGVENLHKGRVQVSEREM